MATDKLFTVAGISTLNGDTKPRFANDQMRVKVLAKNGHSDIELVELPEAMTKTAAVEFLLTIDEFSSPEAQAVLTEYLERNGTPAPKAEVKAPKAAKAEVKAPRAKETVSATADEDKPFGVA